MITNISKLKIAFFGTPDFAVTSLNELVSLGIIPQVIVTQPNKPAGRKMVLTKPPAKVWADENNIKTLQPTRLDSSFVSLLSTIDNFDLFVVSAYGVIIPKTVLNIPKYGTLNIHPSLLPKWRGSSPLQSALLKDEVTGVSIMLMDEKMDHGPIIDQALTYTDTWPIPLHTLSKITAKQGAQMIAELLPEFISGNIDVQEQQHSAATFTKKITKEDGKIFLDDNPMVNYRKFCAYSGWPRIFFFSQNGKRIIISDANLENGMFIIKKVIPEGKCEIKYNQFLTQ